MNVLIEYNVKSNKQLWQYFGMIFSKNYFPGEQLGCSSSMEVLYMEQQNTFNFNQYRHYFKFRGHLVLSFKLKRS